MIIGVVNIFIQFWINEEQRCDGVTKKIECQTSELSKLIESYKAVIIGPKKCFDTHKNHYKFYQKVTLFKSKIFVENILFIKCFFFRKILTDNILNLSKDDIIYIRYPILITSIPLRFFFKKKRFKLIFEHNTIELEEFKLRNGKFSLSYFHEFFFGCIIRSISDVIIGVTEEITQYEISFLVNQNKPHYTIGNGIIVKNQILRNHKRLKYDCYELICVAQFNKWHGIDRLINGLNQYNKKIPVILHLVGNGIETFDIPENSTNERPLFSIIKHGFMTGIELDHLFNQCHIAVGSLGLHRIGLNESSTLKAREYCARGIPYIIACGDPDFPDDFPYIFRVPPDESPIDIESVINFAQKVCSDPDHPQKMRKYAEENLDWAIKMKKLKEFLETLVDEHQSV